MCPVVVFTAALFLSGYAIQQRTLRDLREAIKPSPRPKPQIFLPDRFRSTTTELADGTVIVVDIPPGPDAYRPPRPDTEQVVVEITSTVPGDDKTQTSKQERKNGDFGVSRDGKGEHALSGGERKQTATDDKQSGSGGTDTGQKKDDRGEGKRPKKLSRAERRRQIKEELQKMSQGDRRGLWQPRLW